MFKMSSIVTNTSTQACWPLVTSVISQRLLQASPHMQQMLSQLISVMNVTVTLYYITCEINKHIAYMQRAFIPISRYIKILKSMMIFQSYDHKCRVLPRFL